jgi:hypothetical protein
LNLKEYRNDLVLVRVNVGLNLKLVPFLLAIAYYSYVECEGWTEKAEEKKHNGRDKCG